MPARDRGLMHQGRGRAAAEQSARARRIAEDRDRQIAEARAALLGAWAPTDQPSPQPQEEPPCPPSA